MISFPHTLGELFREVFQTIEEKSDYELYNNSSSHSTSSGEIVEGGFDDVQYSPTEKKIKFYSQGEIKKVIDTSDFVKDGMVSDVRVDEENDELILEFNTDSGKTPISIPLEKLLGSIKKIVESLGLQVEENKQAISDNKVTSISNETITNKANEIWKK